jgi:hypothetical protein
MVIGRPIHLEKAEIAAGRRYRPENLVTIEKFSYGAMEGGQVIDWLDLRKSVSTSPKWNATGRRHR